MTLYGLECLHCCPSSCLHKYLLRCVSSSRWFLKTPWRIMVLVYWGSLNSAMISMSQNPSECQHQSGSSHTSLQPMAPALWVVAHWGYGFWAWTLTHCQFCTLVWHCPLDMHGSRCMVSSPKGIFSTQVPACHSCAFETVAYPFGPEQHLWCGSFFHWHSHFLVQCHLGEVCVDGLFYPSLHTPHNTPQRAGITMSTLLSTLSWHPERNEANRQIYHVDRFTLSVQCTVGFLQSFEN